MIQSVLNVPTDDASWDIWGFANAQCIREIDQAIATQLGQTLFDYQLYPIPWNAVEVWLERNQSAHSDFNGVLKLNGVNIQDVDLKDESAKAAWIYNVFNELYSARAALKI